MTASTRRTALGAILAAPLTGGGLMALPSDLPRPAALAVSPELIRLITKHDRINAILDAEGGSDGSPSDGTCRAAGVARARIAAFASRGWPDILAKAECLARLYPRADAEFEVREQIASGHAYIDCMALNIAVEVMKLREGTLCA